jgi:hypothetical protein
MSTMAVTLWLLILTLFFFNAFSTAASLAELHSTSTAISSFQTSTILRALSASGALRPPSIPAEITEMLSMKDTDISLLDRRGWTKEQYSVFLGWMIPFGVFVATALLFIFFGAKIHAAWRRCWVGREDVGAAPT